METKKMNSLPFQVDQNMKDIEALRVNVENLNAITNTLNEDVAALNNKIILLNDLYPTSNVSDSTYADYPYRYDFEVTGLTSNDVVEVMLSLADATSGNVAPITISDVGKFSIYCKTDSSITDTINVVIFKG